MPKLTSLLVAALTTCLPALAAPKAYDLVTYKGQAAGLTLNFEFADGYPEASKLKVTTAAGKSTKFQLDGSGKMRFVPAQAAAETKVVSLELDPLGAAPAVVTGTYISGTKKIGFTLRKEK